ncbi:hypothetical protein PF004_g18205 [Phytophthora fragariae]|uniref:CCHC-type domain-containing protein n=2 Tax=Phytophthora fragariae TaxID=53985 RepID=A0A6G0ND85_9STRA|nr:hypothetical protein PF004_g18205 [Phytophthora fragariae]
MMGDLWADEEGDEFKDAEEEREEDGAQAELEYEEKRTVPDADEHRDRDAEGLSGSTPAPGVYWSQGFGYDDSMPVEESPLRSFYGAHVKEEPREVPSRSPSGFIPLYTGTERRLPNPPMYGWSVGAQAGYYGGWGATVKTEPTGKQDVKREQTNMVIRTKTPVPGTVPANKKQPAPASHGGAYRTAASRAPTRSAYDLSSMVSNVMKVLPVFYSDTATTEKARDFWELFEAHTSHLPDQSRLLVFRQKIKGRPAERWWNNSTIKTFSTLKVRFHNQFLSRTADELWERLQTTKRERGESVEEWGDRVSDLCDSLDYPNPQMRYQLFRRGLRNKRMLASLDSGPARDIPEACEWLLAKEMSRPIEEDDEFPEDKKTAGASSGPADVATAETSSKLDKLTETMTTFVTQQQQWQQQMMRSQWQPPRSPRNRMPNVSATTSSPGPSGNAPPGNGRPRGIRMGADSRTQEGAPVCGRCGYVGHSRETCRRQMMICNQCGELGHIAVECEEGPSRGRNGGQVPAARNGGRGPMKCGFCKEDGHSFAGCPEVAALRGLAVSLREVNDSEGEDRDRDEVERTVSTVDVCMNVSAELDGMEPTLDDVLHGENKNKIEKKKAEFIVVSTDDEGENLVVKVDDLKHEKVYEDWKTDAEVRIGSEGLGASSDGVETSEVEKDESVEEETEPTEVNAGDGSCEEELGDELSKAITIEDVRLDEEVPTPFADAPPPYVAKIKDESMEESPAPFADAPPPYEWGDEEYDLSDCLLSTWTEGEAILAETVTEDGTVPLEVEAVSGYDHLFLDA